MGSYYKVIVSSLVYSLAIESCVRCVHSTLSKAGVHAVTHRPRILLMVKITSQVPRTIAERGQPKYTLGFIIGLKIRKTVSKDIRLSKWWQIFHFRVNSPFNPSTLLQLFFGLYNKQMGLAQLLYSTNNFKLYKLIAWITNVKNVTIYWKHW